MFQCIKGNGRNAPNKVIKCAITQIMPVESEDCNIIQYIQTHSSHSNQNIIPTCSYVHVHVCGIKYLIIAKLWTHNLLQLLLTPSFQRIIKPFSYHASEVGFVTGCSFWNTSKLDIQLVNAGQCKNALQYYLSTTLVITTCMYIQRNHHQMYWYISRPITCKKITITVI